MECITYYDEKRDKGVTVGGMNIDLADAVENGVIEDIGVAPEFNDLDDPLDIGGHVTTIFQAIEAANERALKQAQSDAAAAKAAAAALNGVTPKGESE